MRKFSEALELIRKYEGPEDWMARAIATQQEIARTRHVWTLARSFPGGDKLTAHNLSAVLSFLAESDYHLESALEADALTPRKPQR